MADTARGLWSHLIWLGFAVAVSLLACLALLASKPGPTEAAIKKSGSCTRPAVVVDGQRFRGDQLERTIRGPITSIFVDGRFAEFRVVPSTFAVRNYAQTGLPSADPDKTLVTERTVIFESKVPNHGERLNGPLSLDLNAEGVVLERGGGGQDMKIQAKDCPQGGLFQMEPEPATTETNTLGPGFTYENGTPGQDGPLCLSNNRFSGFDSPEVATLVGDNTAKVATWRVAAGGRVGMVIGEDAIEEGCTI